MKIMKHAQANIMRSAIALAVGLWASQFAQAALEKFKADSCARRESKCELLT